MLGRNEFALRQGFAWGKMLVRRERPAPPCGAPVLSGIETVPTGPKGRHALLRASLFAF